MFRGLVRCFQQIVGPDQVYIKIRADQRRLTNAVGSAASAGKNLQSTQDVMTRTAILRPADLQFP